MVQVGAAWASVWKRARSSGVASSPRRIILRATVRVAGCAARPCRRRPCRRGRSPPAARNRRRCAAPSVRWSAATAAGSVRSARNAPEGMSRAACEHLGDLDRGPQFAQLAGQVGIRAAAASTSGARPWRACSVRSARRSARRSIAVVAPEGTGAHGHGSSTLLRAAERPAAGAPPAGNASTRPPRSGPGRRPLPGWTAVRRAASG